MASKVKVEITFKKRTAERKIESVLKKNWFHITLLVCFVTPIVLLMILDYLNIETLYAFNLRGFVFLRTWKGRMFYLFFLWLLLLESIISMEKIVEKKPKKRFRILLIFICAIVPLMYILSVNFLGLDQVVTRLGQDLGFTEEARVLFHWPISIEYFVFAISFLVVICLAYGKNGLNFFSISSSLLVGISAIFTLDTFYPEGTFKPFELLALPTSACAAALLDILGYNFYLQYRPGPESMPLIVTPSGSAAIGWPCAGIHSLFLFTVIILLLFKKSNISSFRKLLYFIVGAICTYFVNVLRIASYFFVLSNNGIDAARYFHDTTGELYFVFWIFAYILIIVSIENFRLIEKARCDLQRLYSLLRNIKTKLPPSK
jgi:thaumarchaeosortase